MSSSVCLTLALRVSAGISCSFAFLILIYITWKGFSALFRSQMVYFFKIMFLFYMIASWLALFSLLLHLSISPCLSDILHKVSYLFAAFSYFCVLFPLILIILTARLHFTFVGSVYKVQPYILRSVYIGIAISIACNLVYI